jgi:outer membrane protein assembly factor BamD
MSCLLGASGCGSLWNYYFEDDLFGGESSPVEKGAVQLARDGVEAMREKDYDKALEAFQQLKERYPYSKYAILAELKVGDAHFYKKEYADAAVAYEEFVRLHPRNEVIPYVLYQLGMCHFLSFKSMDRDLEETQTALKTFQRLVQAFPNSEYSRKAKKQILECEKRIAANEFHIGRFYYRQNKYTAAKNRFEHILEKYPQAARELQYEEPIEEMLAECDRHIEEGGPKESIWTRLGF